MGTTATTMLFSPPLPPLQLRPHLTVVIGRSRSCHLRLPSADASRRHAEIVAEEDGFVLRDLGSTNGTLVNGEPVQEWRLSPGDRIHIGSSEITFCQVDTAIETHESADEQTLLLERPVIGDAFHGDLAEIPSFGVLQMLELGRQSGALHVESDVGAGCLWLGEGAPLHARTKDHEGFEAAVEIVNARSGRFSFEKQSALPERTITCSVTELLLEASRLDDERKREDSAAGA